MSPSTRRCTRKIVTYVFHRQIAALDQLVVEIRIRHRVFLNRSDIIEAIVEASMRGASAERIWDVEE